MQEPRWSTRWGFWVAIGLMLLVSYPLSFGPAYWMVRSSDFDSTARRAFDVVYRPLIHLACRNRTVADSADWYLKFGLPAGREVVFGFDDITDDVVGGMGIPMPIPLKEYLRKQRAAPKSP